MFRGYTGEFYVFVYTEMLQYFPAQTITSHTGILPSMCDTQPASGGCDNTRYQPQSRPD